MSKTRIVLNSAGIRELLSGAEMREAIQGYGERARQGCTAGSASPDEFELTVRVRGDRVAARISPGTARARYSNLKHNTLLKAVHKG